MVHTKRNDRVKGKPSSSSSSSSSTTNLSDPLKSINRDQHQPSQSTSWSRTTMQSNENSINDRVSHSSPPSTPALVKENEMKLSNGVLVLPVNHHSKRDYPKAPISNVECTPTIATTTTVNTDHQLFLPSFAVTSMTTSTTTTTTIMETTIISTESCSTSLSSKTLSSSITTSPTTIGRFQQIFYIIVPNLGLGLWCVHIPN